MHYDKCPVCKKKAYLNKVTPNFLKIKKCCNFCELRLAKQKQHPKYQLTIKVRDWAK